MATENFKPIPTLTEEQAKRFREKTSCAEWRGTFDSKDYGIFTIDEEPYKAQRMAYALAYGKDPAELCVLHSCDNPSCVNPLHLFLGTLADNIHDMVNKGRQPRGETHGFVKHPGAAPHGEGHPKAKLTERDVLEIRDLLERGVRAKTIYTRYDISYPTLQGIKHRRTWRHI